VQTRHSAIVEPTNALLVRWLQWAGLPLLVAALAINLLLFLARRRER
jgi:hypothetical protein